MSSTASVAQALEGAREAPSRAREVCVELGHRLGRGALAAEEAEALRAVVAAVRRDAGGKLDGYLEALHDLLGAFGRAALGREARARLGAWLDEVPGRGNALASLAERPRTAGELARSLRTQRAKALGWLEELERAGLVEPASGAAKDPPRRVSPEGAEAARARADLRAAAAPEAPAEPQARAAGWRSAATRGKKKG